MINYILQGKKLLCKHQVKVLTAPNLQGETDFNVCTAPWRPAHFKSSAAASGLVYSLNKWPVIHKSYCNTTHAFLNASFTLCTYLYNLSMS